MRILLFLCAIISLSAFSNELEIFKDVSHIEAALKKQLNPPSPLCSYSEKKRYKNKKRKIRDFKNDKIKISSVSPQTLNDIFQYLKSLDHIPFGYAKDGCYARAHEMAMILEEKGIKSGKVFLEGDLKVKKGKEDIKWWYHVAPIIMSQDEVYVLDPSIFNKPVKLQTWINIQTKHNDNKYDSKYITNRFYYTPNDKEKHLKKYEKEDLEDVEITLPTYLKIQNSKKVNK